MVLAGPLLPAGLSARGTASRPRAQRRSGVGGFSPRVFRESARQPLRSAAARSRLAESARRGGDFRGAGKTAAPSRPERGIGAALPCVFREDVCQLLKSAAGRNRLVEDAAGKRNRTNKLSFLLKSRLPRRRRETHVFAHVFQTSSLKTHRFRAARLIWDQHAPRKCSRACSGIYFFLLSAR